MKASVPPVFPLKAAVIIACSRSLTLISSWAKAALAGRLPSRYSELIPSVFRDNSLQQHALFSPPGRHCNLIPDRCVCVHANEPIRVCVCLQQECRARKNFSSLYAIVSALQSNPIHRLRRTWQDTDRSAAERIPR